MKRLLQGMLARVRRSGRSSSALPSPTASRSPAEQRLAARTLAEAIDRAVDCGHWSHAHRLARHAGPLADEHPSLTDRMARLRLADDDPEGALALIDVARCKSAGLRMLRAACLIRLGRRDQAHADLHRWSRKATAPLDARLLLALLEWESGDHHAAVQTLLRNLRHLNDPRSLELLLLLSCHDARREKARVWAQRLLDCHLPAGDEPETEVLYQSLDLSLAGRSVPAPGHVATLALELVSAEPVLPSLVEAQHVHDRPAMVRVLAAAVEKALPEFVNEQAALEALADLSIVMADSESAIRWADRARMFGPIQPALQQRLVEFLAAEGADTVGDVVARIGGGSAGEAPRREEKAA